MNDRAFDTDWPHPCPPSDTVPTEGRVYRLARTNPHSVRDTKTHHQRGPQAGPFFDPCGRCALSVFLNEDDAVHLFRKNRHQGKYIIAADLAHQHGQMKASPGSVDSHASVWFYSNIPVDNLFRFHAELENEDQNYK